MTKKEKKETKTYDQYKVNEFTRMVPTDMIDFNSFNPNVQDDKTFERLVVELREIGRLIEPIEVIPKSDGRFTVLGGEHRLKAARVLGWTEIPATLLTEERWQEADVQKFSVVKMNMLRGKLDPEKMARLYTEMSDKYGVESVQQLFAITDQEQWDKIVNGVSKAMKKALPKPIADKFDKLSKGAKSTQDLGLIINQLVSEYGDSLNESFMIFTFGGKEHIYVNMSEDTRTSMKKVLGYCQKYKKDINDVIATMVKDWVKEANKLAKVAATDAEDEPQADLKATGAEY